MTSRITSDQDSNADEDQSPREGDSRFALPPDAPSGTKLALHQQQPANFAAATLRIFRDYAAEIRAFLRARTNSRVSMEDVFSVFSEDVWKGLPRFRGDGPVRAWVYALARHALARHLRLKQRWRSRHVLADFDDVSADHKEARRSLATQLGQTAELEPLLAVLAEPDRRLLEQRLLWSMRWRDIVLEQARVREVMSEVEIAKESARLRKRFQLILQSLRDRAGKTRDPDAD